MSDIERMFAEQRKAAEQRRQQESDAKEQVATDQEERRIRFREEVKPFVEWLDAFLDKSGAAITKEKGFFERMPEKYVDVGIEREVSFSVVIVPKVLGRGMIPSFGFAVSIGEDRDCGVALFERGWPGGYRKEIFEGSESIFLGRYDEDRVRSEIEQLFTQLLSHALKATEHLM
ncbi:hypothetical protein [Burkholderia gladioli]|uniref:hypothetical protein n=1 Tax=Burkholderia gladioli TaxID=28095 RepID=UPI002FE39F94